MNKFLALTCAICSSLTASQLKIYDDKEARLLTETTDLNEIASILNKAGVRFEQWEAGEVIDASSNEEEIKKAYEKDISRLKMENGFEFVDVLRMAPDHPKKAELRQKFLNEHTHDEPEIRFFVEGSGHFFLHIKDKVYSVLCEKNDLISVPENVPHWFDMSKQPFFTAIRFFTRTDGWIAHFTDNPISQKFVE